MIHSESDDDPYRQSEVQKLKNDISNLDHRIADLMNKRRFLKYRLSNLEYELKQSDDYGS